MFIRNTHYIACGNRVLIHHLDTMQDLETLRSRKSDLSALAKIGIKNKADSIMVVTGNPANNTQSGYNLTMDVFEPQAFFLNGNDNAWSTMCGNGIRAVAQYLEDYYQFGSHCIIRTPAGDQTIERSQNGWKVDMGNFYNSEIHLQSYVIKIPTRQDIQDLVNSRHIDAQPYIGFHAQPTVKTPDGEPHLVLFHNSAKALQDVKTQADILGPILTTYVDWFPLEINTNIASIQNVDVDLRRIDVLLATYERNIYYVTQACGTGSTVVAASIMDRLQLQGVWTIHVHNLGGELIVETNTEGTYRLSGPAYCI